MDKIENISNKINPILKKYSVIKAGIFGSYSRNENHENSDLDILVSFEKPISLISFYRLKRELEQETGLTVDLVSENSLISHFRNFVEKDLIKIYG